MKAQQIHDRKASKAVATIGPDATLQDVAAELGGRKIGALIVLKADGGVAGVISERDLVKAIAQKGAEALSQRVDAIMTKDVKCVSPDDDSDSILSQMTDGRFRHMPLIKDGEMIGLISIGDVVSAHIDYLADENEALEGMIRAATA